MGRLYLTLALMVTAVVLGACKQQERKLKRIVQVDTIKSPKIRVDGSRSIDVEYLLNNQIHEVMDDSGNFVLFERSSQKDPSTKTATSTLPQSEEDRKLLKKYGFKSSPISTLNSKATDKAKCLLNEPQLKLQGQVRSFELTSRSGARIGFSDLNPIVYGGGLQFQAKSMRFEVGMQAYDALTEWEVGAAQAVKRRTELDFGLDLGVLPIDLSYYYKTPMAEVTHGGLSSVLENVNAKLDETLRSGDKRVPWKSRVIQVNPEYNNTGHPIYLILGGRLAGLEKGDKFKVHNMKYLWEGRPCHSQLRDRLQLSDKPTAIVKTIDRGLHYAVARPTRRQKDSRVQLGAQVRIQKLKKFKE